MTISTHVLDTSIGRPAASITVQLQRQTGAAWADVSKAVTDRDGRVTALLPPSAPAGAGGQRPTFDRGGYFPAPGAHSVYPPPPTHFLAPHHRPHYPLRLLLP